MGVLGKLLEAAGFRGPTATASAPRGRLVLLNATPESMNRAGMGPAAGRRSYQAATTDRLTSNWTVTPLTPDEKLHRSLRTMRTRSRQQGDDNDWAKRYLGLLQTNVIGPAGILLASRVRRNGKPDKPAQKAIQQAWKMWAEDPELCDVQEKRSFLEMQTLFIRQAAEDGESLWRLVSGAEGGPYGLRLQQLDPELLDVMLNQENLRGGGWIRMGIEFDAWGRAVAYHLRQPARFGYGYSSGPMGTRRVPAREIVHAYIGERAGQSRGVPWMHTALWGMQMLDSYVDAAVVNARAGAMKLGVLTSPDGAVPKTLQDGEQGGTSTPKSGTPVFDLEAGSFTVVPEGYTFTEWNPSYPHEQFEPFTKNMLRGLASGLGVSYNSLANDLESTSYASGRQGLIDERDGYRFLQSWTATSFHRPIFREWLPMALAMQQIVVEGDAAAGGKSMPLRPSRVEDYMRAEWMGRRWDWVDPGRDIKAARESVDARFTSISEIIRQRSQRDPEEVFEEIAEDAALMDELGVQVVAKQMPGTPANQSGGGNGPAA